MSSILDALKKLEQEKAGEANPASEAFDETLAEDELLGRRLRGEHMTVRLTPTTMLLGGGVFAVVLVAFSVVVVLVVVRSTDRPLPPQHVSQVEAMSPAPPAPPDGPGREPQEAVVPDETGPVQPMDVAELVEPPTVEEIVDPPLPPPRPAERPAELEQPVFVRPPSVPVPDPEPQRSYRVEFEPPPQGRSEGRVVAQPPPPAPTEPVELSKLPVLTDSERDRLGLPELKINFVSEGSRSRPRPNAVINLQRVYLYEVIPNTNARLIAVSLHGIGIDVGGQRYLVTNR